MDGLLNRSTLHRPRGQGAQGPRGQGDPGEDSYRLQRFPGKRRKKRPQMYYVNFSELLVFPHQTAPVTVASPVFNE